MIATFFVFFVILFICWQLYIFKKYNIGYDNVRIDLKNSKIYINKKGIKLSNIDSAKIIDDEQPSNIERALSKGAAYVHLSTIELHLNNGSSVFCKTNSKSVVDKIIEAIKPNAEIVYDSRNSTESNGIPPFIIAIGFILFMLLVVYIIPVISH